MVGSKKTNLILDLILPKSSLGAHTVHSLSFCVRTPEHT